MNAIRFGDPALSRITKSRQGLRGVAFIENDKPIGFVFESILPDNLNLNMEPSSQSLKLYEIFKKIFIVNPAPMNKYWGNIGNDLHVEFKLKAENRNIMLQNIEKEMNAEWKKAIDTLLSLSEK